MADTLAAVIEAWPRLSGQDRERILTICKSTPARLVIIPDLMNILESIRLATRGLSANKLRSALTMLGMIIGVSAVIAMIAEGESLAEFDLPSLTDGELADEIERRRQLFRKWTDIYYATFIPLAHGIRLFGQTYNDALRPADPYEFMDLLGGTEMIGMERNRVLGRMAGRIRGNPRLAASFRQGYCAGLDTGFDEDLEHFSRTFGDLGCGTERCFSGHDALIGLLLRMAEAPPARERFSAGEIEERREAFLSRFEGPSRLRAAEILDLGRASYRLRDDDNIYMGKIQAQIVAAVDEGKKRLRAKGRAIPPQAEGREVAGALKDPHYRFKKESPAGIKREKENAEIRSRQLVGQPAGPGIATGRARVIRDPDALRDEIKRVFRSMKSLFRTIRLHKG